MPQKVIEKKTKRFKPRLIKKTKTTLPTEAKNPSRRPILKIIITKAALPITLLLAIPAQAKSLINPITQAYSVLDTDRLSGLSLKRTYSSTSIFRGHFGTGWCSELDGRVISYDGGETRYRGCDTDTADLLDARESATLIKRTSTGFSKLRGDGATQYFSRSGYLEKVVRSDGQFEIERDSKEFPTAIVVFRNNTKVAFKISLDAQSFEPSFALIRAIGNKKGFDYTRDLLTTTFEGDRVETRFSYDDQSNMITRTSKSESETIDYEVVSDRVVRIEKSSAFGRERLLLGVRPNEKSGKQGLTIEMKLETERGAETHPVRILYEVTTRKISLEGDPVVARVLLNWIRV